MRDYLFVINCRLRKKTQNCPKTSVFDQKIAIPWSIFPEKKLKTVPHLRNFNYNFSEQSERFNFSPSCDLSSIKRANTRSPIIPA